MKAPEPIPRVPMENLRSRSMSELRFASRMAFTLLEVQLRPTRGVRGGMDLHLFRISDIGDKIPRFLDDLIAEFMVRFKKHLNFCVIVLSAHDIVSLLCQIHS